MTKYDYLSELYDETAKRISATAANWQAFLNSACYNYKLRFDELVLVYAQRPDATAVLQMERWNSHFGRWVERGSKGIAVFANAERRKQDIIRYFDVSDTQEGKYSRPVPLWSMQVDDTVEVINCLSRAFGVNNTTLIMAVKDAAKKLAEDKIDSYLHELTNSVTGSLLEGLDEYNLTVEYRRLIANSVAYMTLARLGFNAGDYFDENTFDGISDFSTPAALNSLGVAVRDISVIELGEISKTIISKSYGKTLALNRERDYNITENKSERSLDNDERDSVQGGRKRIPDARPETSGTAGGGAGAIRNGSQEISAGGAPHNIYEPADLSTAHSASSRGGAESQSVRGEAGAADDGKRRSDGTAQSRGYDELGEKGEQHPQPGEGDRERGDNLQHLKHYDWEHEDRSLPFFGNTEDINFILLNAPLSANKDEIRTFFEANAEKNARISFIKNIFNTGVTELTNADGQIYGYEKMDNVLHMWKGSPENKLSQSFYNWSVIASYYNGLALIDRLSDQPAPEFEFTTKIKDLVICKGGNVENGKMRIYDYFRHGGLTQKENVDFLKIEYGWGGTYPLIASANIDEMHDTKGIHLSHGFGQDAPKITLTWPQVSKKIIEFINEDKYLTPEEKAYYPKWKDKQEQRRAELQASKSHGIVQQEDISAQPTNSGNTEPMESLDGHSMNEFEDFVITKSQAIAEELGENTDIKIIGARVYGSRSRNNLSIPDSDVDVVLSYDGNIPEDGFFNILNEHSLSLYGLKIDVNPISVAKTGTLEDYMEAANVYLDEKAGQAEQYKYNVGDTVYVGTAKYEITAIDNDKIQLADANFPMISREMPRQEFDKKIEENPMNSFLKVKVPAEPAAPEAPEENHIESEAEKKLQLKGITIDLNSEHGSLEINFPDKPTDAIRDVLKENKFRWHKQKKIWYGYGHREDIAGKLLEVLDNTKTLTAVEAVPESTDIAEVSNDSSEDFLEINEELSVADTFSDRVPEVNLMTKAKALIEDFYRAEFEDDGEADMSDLSYVELAYTTTENEKHEIQSCVNFEKNAIETYVDDVLVRTEDYKDLTDLIENGLTDMSFDELISVSNEEVSKAVAETETAIEKRDSNSFEIYQLKNTESTRDFRYEPYDRLIATGHEVNFENYELTYTDELLPGTTLEDIFRKFNIERPVDFKGHSLSVSDVVVLHDDGKTTANYVDSIGFVTVPDFIRTPDIIQQATTDEPAEIQPTPSWVKRQVRMNFANPYPDVPNTDKVNFDLSQHPVEEVSKKARYQRNIEAINVIKECKFENRLATPEEQIKLSKYVGWGGLPEAFDEKNAAWANEFIELQIALDPDEYAAARESTLTAFFTPPEVISAIYKVMENLGFQKGNILEPACGIGNFMGMLPESMKESHMYGVELDSISAQISQQLYQKNSIVARGFEETDFQDNFFDAVIGNVPFGDFKVADKKYDKNNFLIHDYFFAKSLDKLRPGGVIALITSKGTMDKENPSVRKYIAQRADLLGAIRLPNNTFKGNAGTEVVSDILVLQKRDRIVDIEPDWVHLNTDENGRKMNSYFVEHPEMVLGRWETVSGRFGMEDTVVPFETATLSELLDSAINKIHGEISALEGEEELEEEDNSLPADPEVRNFSYTLVDGTVYYRENSRMAPPALSSAAENRIKGMIEIRDTVRNLIKLQTEDYPDKDILSEQQKLNSIYDSFTAKYGLLCSRANSSAFASDSSYPLLTALEIVDEEGKLERKADMFFKRTIRPHIPVTSVDTAAEAFAVSMGEKAYADMEYMSTLTGKTEEEIYNDLKGVIFLNPLFTGTNSELKYIPADEYLSGNVREKLRIAELAVKQSEEYAVNVEALRQVQPEELTPGEISVRLGATWIPANIIEQFMFELLNTPHYCRWNIHVNFSEYTGEWNIEGKSVDRINVNVYSTYGTDRVNAYKIIEDTLNLRDVQVLDYVSDAEGRTKSVLNKKETAIAQAKQDLVKQEFENWIWKDSGRRNDLVKLYNEKFNSVRPREYDGSHLNFAGMNPEIELRKHQLNAVAHIIYGGNTLLAHVVGAGKTYEMVAAAQESKRLGLCEKSLIVVPNHLTEQWAAEYLQLYPSANILVATKKDFEKKNRKKFCGRIATGDYDAVIIGHSQFEKIPMSIERQELILQQQLNEVLDGIAELKSNRGDRFSIKQLEKTKKSIKLKLDKLNSQERKDDVVTFEELGVDRLFVDEAHMFKNRAKRCA